jgi:hypothetical protein
MQSGRFAGETSYSKVITMWSYHSQEVQEPKPKPAPCSGFLFEKARDAFCYLCGKPIERRFELCYGCRFEVLKRPLSCGDCSKNGTEGCKMPNSGSSGFLGMRKPVCNRFAPNHEVLEFYRKTRK